MRFWCLFVSKMHGNLNVYTLNGEIHWLLKYRKALNEKWTKQQQQNVKRKKRNRQLKIKARSVRNYLCLLSRVDIKVKVTPNAFIYTHTHTPYNAWRVRTFNTHTHIYVHKKLQHWRLAKWTNIQTNKLLPCWLNEQNNNMS